MCEKPPHMCAAHLAEEIVRREMGDADRVEWRYVTGGRGVHAFLPGDEVPCCGVVPMRGPEDRRRPSPWHRWGIGFSWGWCSPRSTRRSKHGECERRARARVALIREQMRARQREVIAELVQERVR